MFINRLASGERKRTRIWISCELAIESVKAAVCVKQREPDETEVLSLVQRCVTSRHPPLEGRPDDCTRRGA
jgi:hypothetical protein